MLHNGLSKGVQKTYFAQEASVVGRLGRLTIGASNYCCASTMAHREERVQWADVRDRPAESFAGLNQSSSSITRSRSPGGRGKKSTKDGDEKVVEVRSDMNVRSDMGETALRRRRLWRFVPQ